MTGESYWLLVRNGTIYGLISTSGVRNERIVRMILGRSIIYLGLQGN
jgi:hypothetical protein